MSGKSKRGPASMPAQPLKPDVIVTSRVADVDVDAFAADGSVERTCSLCDAPVLISPSTLAVFQGQAMPPILCSFCAIAMVTTAKS